MRRRKNYFEICFILICSILNVRLYFFLLEEKTEEVKEVQVNTASEYINIINSN